MKECNRKQGFRDCIIYYWTHKEPSTRYSSGCPPTSACFYWTFSQVSKFRVEFLQNGWKYPWFLLVSLVRPVQSLDVSGVWWGDPTTGFLASIWIASSVNTSLIRLIALASSLEGSPSCWTTSCVHVHALQWGSGLWRILTRTRSVANVEQVVYILSFLLKSRYFREGLNKLYYFFNWTFTILWPLSCFGCI